MRAPVVAAAALATAAFVAIGAFSSSAGTCAPGAQYDEYGNACSPPTGQYGGSGGGQYGGGSGGGQYGGGAGGGQYGGGAPPMFNAQVVAEEFRNANVGASVGSATDGVTAGDNLGGDYAFEASLFNSTGAT